MLVPSLTHGQNQAFHPFPNGHTYWYTINDPGSTGATFFAAKVDSVRLEGADSAYYLYRVDRMLLESDTLYDCNGMLLDPSWMDIKLVDRDHCFGKKMLWRANGDCLFISSKPDTCLLKAWAATGQSWNWNATTTALVDSIVFATTYGIPDSVKYISLSSGRHLVLSKGFGFLRSFSFWPIGFAYYPPDTIPLVGYGIKELGLGAQFPDTHALFHHEIGDQWLYRQFEGNAGTSLGNGNLYRTVLIDQVAGLQNTFVRQIDRVSFARATSPVDSIYSFMGTDTITFDSAYHGSFFTLPYQSLQQPSSTSTQTQGGFSFNTNFFNGRMQYYDGYLSGYDSCSRSYDLYGSSTTYFHVVGVGGSASSTYSNGGYYNHTELICFQLGTETYGTCLDLSTLVNIKAAETSSISIFPNPAQLQLTVDFGLGSANFLKRVILFSAKGVEVANFPIGHASTKETFQLAEYPAGIYLIRCEIEGQNPISKRILILR